MNIEIAGVKFGVHAPKSLVLKNANPFYTNFVKLNLSPDQTDIDVTIDFDRSPELTDLSRIFDGEQSWSMWQKEGGNYFVTLNSAAADKKLLFTAEFDRSAKQMTIYSGDVLSKGSNEGSEIFNPFCYPLDQILLVYFLARRGGALVHAAGMELDGKGYIFPGKSGAGKTTLSRQFVARNYQGLISDDRVVIRKIGTDFMAFGTPWPGEGAVAVNKGVPLKGIFFIIHGTSDRIEEVKPGKAVERFMPVTSIPWYDEETISGILSFLEDMISHIPAFDLHFKPGVEVADYFERFVSSL